MVGWWSALALARTGYVSSGCELDGDGSLPDCAASAGGAGAWNALGSASAEPGDTIELRAGTYPAGWAPTVSGTASDPVTVQNYAGEDAVLSGAIDLAGGETQWASVGGSVWRCVAGPCAPADPDTAPLGIWLASGAVLFHRMGAACDADLPKGTFRYGLDGELCASLPDQTPVGDAARLEMPYVRDGLVLDGIHDLVVRRNPAGGSFAIEQVTGSGVVVRGAAVTVDGLDVSFASDRCVDLEDAPDAVVTGVYAYACGQGGIVAVGGATIRGNTVEGVQAPPFVSPCDGGCATPGFDEPCAGIRVEDAVGSEISGNVTLRDCGGGTGVGHDLELRGSAVDVTVDGNAFYSLASGPADPNVAWLVRSAGAGPFERVVLRNNRAFDVDACLGIDLGADADVDVAVTNDTCAEVHRTGVVRGAGSGAIGGSLSFVNDLWSSKQTSPVSAFDLSAFADSAGVERPVTNLWFCSRCTGPLVTWTDGTTYDAGSIFAFGGGNLEGDPELDQDGEQPTLKLEGPAGAAFQRGTTLDPAFPDFEGDPRPSDVAWDIGADALPYDPPGTGSDPTTPSTTPTDTGSSGGGGGGVPRPTCGCASGGPAPGALALLLVAIRTRSARSRTSARSRSRPGCSRRR
jgi:hypothetical protein